MAVVVVLAYCLKTLSNFRLLYKLYCDSVNIIIILHYIVCHYWYFVLCPACAS